MREFVDEPKSGMKREVNEEKRCSLEESVPQRVVDADDKLSDGYGSGRFRTLRSMPERESALLRFAFEHSSDGMLLTDPNGTIQMVNDAFVRMFGFPLEDVIGQRSSFLRSKYSTQEFYEAMWKSLREHGEWKGEIVNRTKHGKEKTCFLTITPIFSEAGERLGYLGVEIDLTERKRMESQIVQGEKLAAIGETVATLVHEIRNPLKDCDEYLHARTKR